MAEDPFVTSSAPQPPILRPIPRRNFPINTDSSDSPSHAHAPSTPPLHDPQNRSSDFLAQLNARLLRTYNTRNAGILENGPEERGGQPPPRNKSFMNLTKSTLFGIYDDEDGTTGDRSVAETPWGTGAETPARKSLDASMWENGLGSPDAGLAVKSHARTAGATVRGPRSPVGRPPLKPQRRGLWKYTMIAGKLAALFLFGMVYGVVISHLHDTRELAAVRVGGVDRENWVYLMSWGLAGIALGCSLPYVELAWGGQVADTPSEVVEPEKESESGLGEQWNDIVRSVGAFMGIAFAIVSSHPLLLQRGSG